MPEQTQQLQKVSTILGIVFTIGIIFFGAVKLAYESGASVQEIKSLHTETEYLRNARIKDKARTDRVVRHADEKNKLNQKISHLELTIEQMKINYKQDLKQKDKVIVEWKLKYQELKETK